MDSVIGDIAIDVAHLWARELAKSYFARDFLRFVVFFCAKKKIFKKELVIGQGQGSFHHI